MSVRHILLRTTPAGKKKKKSPNFHFLANPKGHLKALKKQAAERARPSA
uniref:Uncharacterized protein n=1 Tax=Anguilla anguilla TaxID=7936 RepID=A0A0E9XJR7_ANGAN